MPTFPGITNNDLTSEITFWDFSQRNIFLITALTAKMIPNCFHYNDVIMGAIASQITSLTIVYSTVYLGADQRKHQSSASLAFVGIHRWPVNFPLQWPVTQKMVQFDDVVMLPIRSNDLQKYTCYIFCHVVDKCWKVYHKWTLSRFILIKNRMQKLKFICFLLKGQFK